MQTLESDIYSIRKMKEDGSYIIIIAHMNQPEYLQTVEAIKMEVENNILYIDYIKEGEVKRTIQFSDLSVANIFDIKQKESIVICEMFEDIEISYEAIRYND